MGTTKHHAIIVTCHNVTLINKAHELALSIFPARMVTGIATGTINGYNTFMVGPDGSNEGWEESNEGDDCRDLFLKQIDSYAYSDGSNSIQYVEMYFGDMGAGVEQTNLKDSFRKEVISQPMKLKSKQVDVVRGRKVFTVDVEDNSLPSNRSKLNKLLNSSVEIDGYMGRIVGVLTFATDEYNHSEIGLMIE